MHHYLITKVQHFLEACFLFLAIHWQPIFGIMASVMAFWYYAAVLKLNVIDKEYNRSWKTYFKHIFKKLFR